MNRRNFLKHCGTAAALGVILESPIFAGTPKPPARRNVLYITVDDLRPALGCYGDKTALTPNIDKLASKGVVFQSAYVQCAICNPSRTSLLTGCRPDTTGVWDLKAYFRDALPDVVTLPQYFKNNGYSARAVGKIFHGSGRPSRDPISWSQPPIYDVVGGDAYVKPENIDPDPKKWKKNATECADFPDEVYLDTQVCQEAVKALGEYKESGEPFFLAVGFRKPHLPFTAPKKYWDLYDPEKIPWPESDELPANSPKLAVRQYRELQSYKDVENERTVSEQQTRHLRHGYYACVSFADAQVGKVLNELERLKLAQDTVVVLWGDHGFHLGEQDQWTKDTGYEWATRAPLIISNPGSGKKGSKTDALVEFVDIYPTLVELCRLDMPDHLEGLSLAPLLDEPGRPWKKAVFSQTARKHKKHGKVMGRAVRTRRYRYIEWRQQETDKLIARELYDHQADSREMANVAGKPQYAEAVSKLSETLKKGWKAALP